MFVYLLIAAELAILYTVFWYLYLREPNGSGRIKASMWGNYEKSWRLENSDPGLSLMHACACAPEQTYHAANSAMENELIFDQHTNHYVPVEESGSVLVRMANSIDRTLSQLNTRP